MSAVAVAAAVLAVAPVEGAVAAVVAGLVVAPVFVGIVAALGLSPEDRDALRALRLRGRADAGALDGAQADAASEG
jgi:hypothetical protein